jgi:hypothetical protein
MDEIRIESFSHLLDELFADSWQEDLRRFRSPYVFRGSSDAQYPLQTSLHQLGGSFEQMEGHLLRNFRKYAHRDIVERDTLWHWLSLGQHHGLPTRLVDWTISPLVAAHFATQDIELFGRDGTIWMVNYRRCHELLPTQLKKELAEEGSDFFTVEMLARITPTFDDLDALAPPPFVVFFEPPSIDDRITNQFALFSLMPDARAELGAWLQDHPQLWRKIVIPAETKWEVRDKLDQINITERVLFPGLDGLSRWQKRYYTPRRSI